MENSADVGRKLRGIAALSFEKGMVSVLVSVADPLTPEPLLHLQLEMEPMAGIEPATDGLRNRCSTAELHWLSLEKQSLPVFREFETLIQAEHDNTCSHS